MDKPKSNGTKNPGTPRTSTPAPKTSTPAAKTGAPPAKPPAPVIMGPLPPLFRRVDWLTLALTFLFTFVGYMLTIAPEMTLEDSGELATGAFYAGIPHPPGYPVWTIYSWLWTVLLPFKNIAWRVAVGTAFSGALASGLLAFVVSRGSSMIIESIDDLKNVSRRLENVVCVIAGFVAGTLIGFNGYMWSQAVIVEVYPLSVASLMGVVLCLLRWVYAPHQHRYLYAAFFLYGICVNNHQSLLVIAMGMEVLVWMAEPKLGREFFFWNSMLFLGGVVIRPDMLWGNMPVRVIFCTIGVASMALYIWLCFKTKKEWIELGRDLAMLAALFFLLVLLPGGITNYVPQASDKLFVVVVFGLGFAGLFGWLISRTWKLSRHWLIALGCGGSWLIGAAFYLFMPMAGASNPPMQWGYPRTLDGFIHAVTRGQYEKIHPTSGEGTTLFEIVGSFINKFGTQLWRAIEGLNLEFNILCLLLAMVVFLYYRKMKRRERVWIIGMVALFICLGPFLVLLLNFGSDRQSLELCRVFLTASHVFVAMSVGFGITLMATSLAVHYDKLRNVAILGGICAVDFGFFLLVINSHVDFNVDHPDLIVGLGLVKILCWLFAATFVVIFWRKGMEQDRTLAISLTGIFVALSLVPTLLAFTGWPMKGGGFAAVGQGLSDAFKSAHYGMPVYAALILLAAGLVFLAYTAFVRSKAPTGIALAVFALLPSYSIMTHWFDNEQYGHYFGYWFGHDMFTPPFVGPDGKLTYDAKLREQAMKGTNATLVYPEMTKDTILFGGTDPGRFAPTYMIFCDSFTGTNSLPKADPGYDRRDVYIITQNALADQTYLEYIRAHYHRSAQKRRGMDTPFFRELLRSPDEREKNWSTNLLARMVSPLDALILKTGEAVEKNRRAGSSLFKGSDFLDPDGFAAKLAAHDTPISRQLFDELSPETKKLLTAHDTARLRAALAADLNRVIEKGIYDDTTLTNLVEQRWQATFALEEVQKKIDQYSQMQMTSEVLRYQARLPAANQAIQRCDAALAEKTDSIARQLATNGVPVSPYLRAFIQEAPLSFTRIRLNRELLEAAYPKEIAVSPGGVYPDREIYIPSPMDSQQCFQDYIGDAQARFQHDRQFPNEPRQIKQGEYVTFVNNKVQVSGQIAVMAINGLLTKVIFDHNPNSDFFVEESFPLDWMYPHLTPFGIIMKINRQPLPELTDDIIRRDHEFWSKYSERLIGNWITYDTSVKEIAEFAQRVYLRHDFSNFKGDLKFVRDDQAQKAFSKLRSSIATSIYAWRLGLSGNITPPQYLPRTEADRQRMMKEADFALRQAFAFCPYSPEAVFHLVQILASQNRLDDALLVAQTCQKLDPDNGQIIGLVQSLEDTRNRSGLGAIQEQIQELEAQVRANPADFQKCLDLALRYLQLQQVDRAVQILDGILDNPKADAGVAYAVAELYAKINYMPKLEATLERIAKQFAPNQPDGWYNLAAVRSTLGKLPEAIDALRHVMEISSKTHAQNPASRDWRAEIQKDPRFEPLRATPEYKALMSAP